MSTGVVAASASALPTAVSSNQQIDAMQSITSTKLVTTQEISGPVPMDITSMNETKLSLLKGDSSSSLHAAVTVQMLTKDGTITDGVKVAVVPEGSVLVDGETLRHMNEFHHHHAQLQAQVAVQAQQLQAANQQLQLHQQHQQQQQAQQMWAMQQQSMFGQPMMTPRMTPTGMFNSPFPGANQFLPGSFTHTLGTNLLTPNMPNGATMTFNPLGNGAMNGIGMAQINFPPIGLNALPQLPQLPPLSHLNGLPTLTNGMGGLPPMNFLMPTPPMPFPAFATVTPQLDLSASGAASSAALATTRPTVASLATSAAFSSSPSLRLAQSIREQEQLDSQRFGQHTWISSLFHDREGKPLLQPSSLLPPPLCHPGLPGQPATVPPSSTTVGESSGLLALTMVAADAGTTAASGAKRKRESEEPSTTEKKESTDAEAMLSSLASEAVSVSASNGERESKRRKRAPAGKEMFVTPSSSTASSVSTSPTARHHEGPQVFSFTQANLKQLQSSASSSASSGGDYEKSAAGASSSAIVHVPGNLYYHPNSYHVSAKKHSKRSSTDKGKDDLAGGDDDAEDDEFEGEDERPSGSNNSRSRYCLPCPLILDLPKVPLQTLYLQVQKQYTISKKEMESRHLSAAAREELVSVPVRIMGSPNDLENLYFVAKDVCLLIFIRKGNVAKVIGQFDTNEKARLPVLCPRSNGTSSTHVLTALSVAGVKRLLGSSKSPLASHVLKFLLDHLNTLGESLKRAAGQPVQASLTRKIQVNGDMSDSIVESNPATAPSNDDVVSPASATRSLPFQSAPIARSSTSRKKHHQVIATITPQSLTIAPHSPSATPTKIVIQ